MLLGFECLRRVYFPKDIIVSEGQMGEGLYIFNEGQATATSKNVVILTLLAGSHFAASIMMGMNKKVICNLIAVTVCHVLIVTPDSYAAALFKYPASEPARELYRTESDAFQELAKVQHNVQMRSNIVRDMVSCMGYEGADTEQIAKMLTRRVFEAWMRFLYQSWENREEERKNSLRRWDQQRWIYNARDGHQKRRQQEEAVLQHLWPLRGGPLVPAASTDACSFQRRRIPPSRDAGTLPVSDSQQDALYLEAMGGQTLQSSREWGTERRRKMIDLYVPPATSQKAGHVQHSSRNLDVLHKRNLLTEMLERTQ